MKQNENGLTTNNKRRIQGRSFPFMLACFDFDLIKQTRIYRSNFGNIIWKWSENV